MSGVGVRFLLISKESKAYKIPIPKEFKFKPIPELSNQEVLEVNLIYGTENRKATHLSNIFFNRLTLDDDGGYEVTWETVAKKVGRVFCEIENGMSENQYKKIYLPIKPVLPTDKEKACILQHIKAHLPALYNNAPYILEAEIKQRKDNFEAQMKKAKDISNAMD